MTKPMKRFLLLFCPLALLMMFFLGCSKGESFFSEGEMLAESGDAEEAIECFHKAAALDYRPGESYYRIGQLYEDRLEQLQLAAWFYQRAILHEQESRQDDSTAAEIRLKNVNARLMANAHAPSLQNNAKEKDEIIAILEERCEDLTKWVQKLNDENFALRQMLLEK